MYHFCFRGDRRRSAPFLGKRRLNPIVSPRQLLQRFPAVFHKEFVSGDSVPIVLAEPSCAVHRVARGRRAVRARAGVVGDLVVDGLDLLRGDDLLLAAEGVGLAYDARRFCRSCPARRSWLLLLDRVLLDLQVVDWVDDGVGDGVDGRVVRVSSVVGVGVDELPALD